MRARLVAAIALLLLGSLWAIADVHVPASLSRADVQTAVTAASDGDYVILPAGSATWDGTAIDVPSTKRLKIIGAGTTATVINGNAKDDVLFDLNNSGSTIAAMELHDGVILINGGTWTHVHHITYDCDDANDFVDFIRVFNSESNTIHPSGLVDNNTITCGRLLVQGDDNLLANDLWAIERPLGRTQRNFVFEDNTMTGTTGTQPAVDCNYGGSYIFRESDITDKYVEMHSIGADGVRACRTWEVYNNDIRQVTDTEFAPFRIRGGTGVIYSNTVHGTWTQKNLATDNVRSDQTTGDVGGTAGACDGTSTWDENQTSLNGYLCRDQPGAGITASASETASQSSDPMYEWSNVDEVAADIDFNVINGEYNDTHIVSARDFFNDTTKTGYTALDYPHPLINTAWAEESNAALVIDLEEGDTSECSSTTVEGTMTLAAQPESLHKGEYGLKVVHDGTNDAAYCVQTFSQADPWVRFYVYYPSGSTYTAFSPIATVQLYDGATLVARIGARDGTAGNGDLTQWAMRYRFDATLTSNTEFSTDQWHLIEVEYVNDGSVGGVRMFANGTQVLTDLDQDSTTYVPDTIRIGTELVAAASGDIVNIDNVVVDSAQIGAYMDPPYDLAASATAQTINLTWTEEVDETHRVERGTTCADTAFSEIGTSTDGTYADTGLTAETEYCYRVRPDNSVNRGGYSMEAYATTEAAVAAGDRQEVKRRMMLMNMLMVWGVDHTLALLGVLIGVALVITAARIRQVTSRDGEVQIKLGRKDD